MWIVIELWIIVLLIILAMIGLVFFAALIYVFITEFPNKDKKEDKKYKKMELEDNYKKQIRKIIKSKNKLENKWKLIMDCYSELTRNHISDEKGETEIIELIWKDFLLNIVDKDQVMIDEL